MKERPIIFSGPMVRAILDGEKTQTRRLSGLKSVNGSPELWRFGQIACGAAIFHGPGPCRSMKYVRCPYPRNDQLWVKEAWHKQGGKGPIIYSADEPDCKAKRESPLFLPRRLSRLILRVTDVRVERLQAITAADVLAEGVRLLGTEDGGIAIDVSSKHVPSNYWPCKTWEELKARPDFRDQMLITHFAASWDTINGKRAAWASNPWVWVVSFERVKEVANG